SDADTLHQLLKRAYVGKKKKRKKGKKATASAHVSKKKGKKKRPRRHTPPIWFSEYSVLSERSPNIWLGFYVSPEAQAQWITAAYQLVNSLPYVAGLGWYRIDDEPNNGQIGAAWGLLTYEGDKKPSYGAYEAAPQNPLGERPPHRV